MTWWRPWQLGCASDWAPRFTLHQVHLLAQSRLVVTGRFHGMCLAILAHRPFVAYASNTNKMEGLLKGADLGPGAQMPPDPRARPDVAMADVQSAVDALSEAMDEPGALTHHQDVCGRYLAHARSANLWMFTQVASLAGRTG